MTSNVATYTNLSERSSMYTENNFGDRIPPCLTPCDIEK